jgi:DNA polymerase elongation subunit (family B)
MIGQTAVEKLSPVGVVKSRTVFTDQGQPLDKWSIKGVSLLDYMELYKTLSLGERESYSLNYIAEYELGEGKIQYNAANLTKLAEDDWELFVDYNIQDVELIVKLEERLKYLNLARMLAYKGCANFEAATGKVSIVSGAVAIEALRQGYIIPTFKKSKGDRGELKGAFVRDPKKGLAKDVVSFDANSLYPNTIITLNISPETKVGKAVFRDEEATVSLVNGKTHKISKDKFLAFLKENKYSLSSAGIIYTQNKKGVVPSFIEVLYKERVGFKNKAKELKSEAQKIKKAIEKHKDDPQNLEMLQKKQQDTLEKLTIADVSNSVLKVLLNSCYGVMSNQHSPFFDMDNALSITATGQEVAKNGAILIDDYAKQTYGTTETVVQYGDTDSLVGDTSIRTNSGTLPIELLYDTYNRVAPSFSYHGHEIINVENDDIKVPTYNSNTGNIEWGKVKNLVRHKVSKKKYKIRAGGKEVIMTEDHGCVVLRDGKIVRVSPKDIKVDTDKIITLEFGYGDTKNTCPDK